MEQEEECTSKRKRELAKPESTTAKRDTRQLECIGRQCWYICEAGEEAKVWFKRQRQSVLKSSNANGNVYSMQWSRQQRSHWWRILRMIRASKSLNYDKWNSLSDSRWWWILIHSWSEMRKTGPSLIDESIFANTARLIVLFLDSTVLLADAARAVEELQGNNWQVATFWHTLSWASLCGS